MNYVRNVATNTVATFTLLGPCKQSLDIPNMSFKIGINSILNPKKINAINPVRPSQTWMEGFRGSRVMYLERDPWADISNIL